MSVDTAPTAVDEGTRIAQQRFSEGKRAERRLGLMLVAPAVIIMLVVTAVASLIASTQTGAVLDGDTLQLWGKSVVITGGATGIGFALAKRIGGAGARIILFEPREANGACWISVSTCRCLVWSTSSLTAAIVCRAVSAASTCAVVRPLSAEICCRTS